MKNQRAELQQDAEQLARSVDEWKGKLEAKSAQLQEADMRADQLDRQVGELQESL